MKFTSFVGIDISKLDFNLALLKIDGSLIDRKTFTNNRTGFTKMLNWLEKDISIKDTLFCLEHSGVYCLPICVFFESSQLSYSIQPALQIKRSMGIQRGKNDKSDAYIIAKYAYLNRNEIECSRLPSRSILKLKQLVAYRDRLVRSKVALQTASKELKAFTDTELNGFVSSDSKRHIQNITKSIAEIDRAMRALIQSDEQLEKLFELATSVKGVGLQLATNMIIITHGFTRFKTWRKFSCYCGLAPFEYSSGTSIRGKTKVSQLGNKRIKAIIGNGVASAIQNDPQLGAYYKRKIKEGKHKMVALNAVKNKLISRVFAVITRGTPYVTLFQHA